jgi:hypothetical protein
VGGMYGSLSKLKIQPLTKSLGPFYKVKWSITTRKLVLYSIVSHFGAKWAPPNGPKVGKMYGSMSKLKNKLITKSLGPFFREK